MIDTHAHMGPYSRIYMPRNRAEDMLATMDRCGIRKTFFAHHRALRDSELGNRDAEAAIRRFPDRFGGYWAVTPLYPERVRKEAAELDRHPGFAGFKILAAYYRVAITDSRCKPVWERAHDEQLPVLVHTWGHDGYGDCPHIEKIAQTYGRATIIMGHAQYGDWDGGIELARRFPNVYLELCAALPRERKRHPDGEHGCAGQDSLWRRPAVVQPPLRHRLRALLPDFRRGAPRHPARERGTDLRTLAVGVCLSSAPLRKGKTDP
ncbi:MAG: amidohydrolase family protein [Spirochaetaceae bacterium]|nr:amidohydrolase family protein [Spirochaetaceae bacterium]